MWPAVTLTVLSLVLNQLYHAENKILHQITWDSMFSGICTSRLNMRYHQSWCTLSLAKPSKGDAPRLEVGRRWALSRGMGASQNQPSRWFRQDLGVDLKPDQQLVLSHCENPGFHAMLFAGLLLSQLDGFCSPSGLFPQHFDPIKYNVSRIPRLVNDNLFCRLGLEEPPWAD